jgi:hypothetical protein
MFSIVNRTSFAFQVQINEGIEGPNVIPPGQTAQYGAPASAPQTCIRAICENTDELIVFEIIHENGNIQLTRGFFDVIPLPSIAWGGEFVIAQR